MKVFIVGDHRTGTGPANVTKEYIEHCPGKVLYQKRTGKLARVPELFIKTVLSDCILFSGYSRQNLLGIKFARMFGRKTAYLMHGCVEHENAINGVPDSVMNECERGTMAGVDAIYAVSERFAGWLRNEYPEYADKIDFVINGIDGLEAASDINRDAIKDVTSDEQVIFSIGGGMPRKKIKHICQAAKLLIDEGMKLKLIVVGDRGFDDMAIDSWDFVDNQGLVNHSKVAEIFAMADIFVQNSCFETFGLAPVEALCAGCSVLLSDKIGALDIIPGANAEDIIYDYEDAREIADKIKGILENPNAKRLADGLDFDKYSWTERGKVLWEKLSQLQK